MKGWKIRSWMILTGFFLLCLVWGVWGLVESGKRFLDACYLTLQLITLNAGLEDGPKAWKLEIARFVLPGIAAYATLKGILLLAGQHLSTLKLKYRVKGHYIICGLGDRGMALARDLLAHAPTNLGNTVAAIDIDPNNPNIKLFRKMGGIFLEGDAREQFTLEQAAIQRAEHLIMLADADAANLAILHVVETMIGETHIKLKCYAHVANRENRALFEEGGVFFPPIRPNGLELALFNVYENAAIELFQKHLLGANADVLTPDAAPVSVLIAGFGHMGEAVLLEAMQLGHFCNQVPIALTVLDDDATSAERRFFQRYREVPNHLGDKGLKLWNLRFIDNIAAAGPLGHYTDILACHDDEDTALVCINDLWERWQGEDGLCPQFFLYSPSRQAISNSGVHAFGNFSQACGAKNVIAKELEWMAKASHGEYSRNKLKDNSPDLYDKVENRSLSLEEALTQHDRSALQAQKLSWQSLSLLKQASNFTEQRHYRIRLHALGLQISRSHEAIPDTSHIKPADYPYLIDPDFPVARLPLAKALLASALYSMQLNQKGLIERIHQLAMAEHNRWNAFHVLNNYKYGSKNERKRSHDCLLNWVDLTERKKDLLKYDYHNIYKMLDILRLIESGISQVATQTH